MRAFRYQAMVLGIGNLLWADEGFGVRCVEAFAAEFDLPPEVLVMDGGTQGLYLLPFVESARRLIVFDAIDYGLEPGEMRTVEGFEVPMFMGAKKMSLHQTGFQEVLACACLCERLPESLLLIGVQPVELEDFGGSLRPAVKARIPAALALAAARLRSWGIAANARPCGAAPSARINDASLDIGGYEAQRPSEGEACRLADLRDVRYLQAGSPGAPLPRSAA